jgi:hypothetical protein
LFVRYLHHKDEQTTEEDFQGNQRVSQEVDEPIIGLSGNNGDN